MRIACWIPKATDTHTEYVILIAFALQQWLRERVSVLRYTYIAIGVGLQNSGALSRAIHVKRQQTAKTAQYVPSTTLAYPLRATYNIASG